MSRLTRAQQLVIRAAIQGRPLPGRSQPDGFSARIDDSDVVLLDDRDPSALDLSSVVRVVDRLDFASLRVDAQIAVLEFLQPEPFPDKIGVRLRLSMLRPDHTLTPVEEIVATFLDSDPLRAVEPTHVLAL